MLDLHLLKVTKTFGLYDFFEGLGFAGGKDGQIDKFPNLLNILNPFKFYPLLFKSFFGKRDESEKVLVVVRLQLLMIIKIIRMVQMQMQWQQKQPMKVVRVML